MTGATTDSTTGPVDGVDDVGYDAVLLAGFGGPESPDEVMPFLRTVTRGRGVPDERLVEVAQHYQALGGMSPINAQNRALRAALEEELAGRGLPLPVLWGNRNSAPWLTDTVGTAGADDRRTRLLGLATSAYSSYSSCRQYREDFAAALTGSGLVGQMRIDKIRPYFDQPGFLDPFVDGTAAAVRAALDGGLAADELELLFTTHSIPTAMADSSGSAATGDDRPGGAYVAQHVAASEYVAGRVAELTGSAVDWRLVYQSRSGPPQVPWLEPDICDVIEDLPGERHGIVVVPIGFVSDHVEVIWDLDHEAADAAAGRGLFFWRVPTPGTDPRFVASLADLIAERVGRGLPREPVLGLPRRPDVCPPGCCVNLRVTKPTTAGQDSALDWAESGIAEGALAASGILQALRA